MHPKISLFTLSRVRLENMRIKSGENVNVRVSLPARYFLHVQNNRPIGEVLEAALKFQSLNDLPRMQCIEHLMEELRLKTQNPISPVEKESAIRQYAMKLSESQRAEFIHFNYKQNSETRGMLKGGIPGALLGAGFGVWFLGLPVLGSIFTGAGVLWSAVSVTKHFIDVSNRNSTISFLGHLEQVPDGSGDG